MFYRLLGMLVWTVGKRVLRRKNGATYLPKPLLAVGLVIVLVGVLMLGRRRASTD